MEKIQAGSSELISGRDSILIDLSSWYKTSLAPKIATIQDAIENRHIEDMKYEWIDEYLLKMPGITKDLQKDWNWIRYQIGGKMFAAICLDDNDKPYFITLKLEPLEGDFWRKQYEDIIPGYYMNKQHWNSVKADGNVPDEILMDLLEKAYRIVLGSLSKKKQKEILGDE